VQSVSDELGNTPAVSRKGYIHPAVIETYLDGTLGRTLELSGKSTGKGNDHSIARLRADERLVLSVLEK